MVSLLITIQTIIGLSKATKPQTHIRTPVFARSTNNYIMSIWSLFILDFHSNNNRVLEFACVCVCLNMTWLYIVLKCFTVANDLFIFAFMLSPLFSVSSFQYSQRFELFSHTQTPMIALRLTFKIWMDRRESREQRLVETNGLMCKENYIGSKCVVMMIITGTMCYAQCISRSFHHE